MQNFRELLDRQKTYFDTDVTKSYEWRIDQLARMERMLKENTEALYEAMQKDFKTASSALRDRS
jgi:aldehyde dehydrogenase (NAD+)